MTAHFTAVYEGGVLRPTAPLQLSEGEQVEAATAWLQQNREPLLTTDYIIDETLTLLVARGQKSRTIRLAPPSSPVGWHLALHRAGRL